MCELNRCKICGQAPEYKRVPADSMYYGNVSIKCCSIVLLRPRDIQLEVGTQGKTGWEISELKLNKCNSVAIERWNELNSKSRASNFA